MIAYGAGAGIFGVELFLLEDGRLLLNEVAPRPHNSGAFQPLSSDVCAFRMAVSSSCGSRALSHSARACG